MIDLTAPGAVQLVMDGLRQVNLFCGIHQEGNILVYADSQAISPSRSQTLRNHSPDGFMWGYGGSGPAQLALAILLAEGLPDDLALELYQDFKWSTVSRWPSDQNWWLRGADLREWIWCMLKEIASRGGPENAIGDWHA